MSVIEQKKSDPPLLFEGLHKGHLMFMDILKTECIHSTFFGIKTDRDPLNGTNIVNGTFLIKISQCDMPACLINIDRCDRRWNLLDQSQSLFQIFFVSSVDQFLKSGSPKTSGIPCCHQYSPYLLSAEAFERHPAPVP